ncbi:MAG: Fic family protein [Euryarchaeota archaeon]|nr:Fic family protein [Euryarchaeota archaeon]
MITYISEAEIIEINRLSLEATKEQDKFLLIQPDDLRFIQWFIKTNFKKNTPRKALAYCISIIILHPFRNGNHRTSLLTAEEFLIKNKYKSLTTDKKDLELQKWRIIYEQDHDLEREFFYITNIEEKTRKSNEIKKIMDSEYGQTIEKWLNENFK